MENSEILELSKSIDNALRFKADGAMTPSALQPTGGQAMDQIQVTKFIDGVINQSAWMKKISSYRAQDAKLEVPRLQFDQPVLEWVGVNRARVSGPQTPVPDMVSFDLKKANVEVSIPRETLLQARRQYGGSTQEFSDALLAMIAKETGNNLGHAIIRGDTTLSANTAWNRCLRGIDGIIKKAKASGTSLIPAGSSIGAAYAHSLWRTMHMKLPVQYRNMVGMEWLCSSGIENSWMYGLDNAGNVGGTLGSPLGDVPVTQLKALPPLGRPMTVIPQMLDDDDGGIASQNPDAVTSPSSNVHCHLNTLLGATSAAGRGVRVTCRATQDSEDCIVQWDGTNNNITTLGDLGQDTISTTTTDYDVKIADMSNVILTHPKNIAMAIRDNNIVVIRTYNKNYDRFEFTLFLEADVNIQIPEAVVIAYQIYAVGATWGA